MIPVTPKIVTDVEQRIHVLEIERLLLPFREGQRNGRQVRSCSYGSEDTTGIAIRPLS
jgi:hypothetical protein